MRGIERYLIAVSVLILVLCLGIVVLIQCFGGYHAVRLRGLTLERISDLGQAERMASRCVGLRLATAKRAFNDDESWGLLGSDPEDGIPCDIGRLPRKGRRCEVWLYAVNSSEKIVLSAEDGVVVGVGGN